MKKLLLSAMIAAAGVVALAPAAYAADGTITFNGSVTANTCTINGSVSPASQSVQLPVVSATTLNGGAGKTAGQTAFQIALANCGGSGSVRAHFEGPNVDTSNGYLLLSGTTGVASNVEIQLLNSLSQPILANAVDGSQNTDLVPISGGGATLHFYAQYISTAGTVSAGSANSSVLYTLSYQ